MEGGSRMDALGKRLQGFRLENGWSKRTIAKQLGVSIPSIIRWEEGISEPNDYNRYKIERLLIGYSPAPARRRIVQLSLFPRYVKETTEELT
jgi:transcriptional regulator with XRE-family HTH domain